MPKTVGILGGMGPEATAEFYRRLIELTPAQRDQDHLPVIVLADPRVPNRTDYILGSGESPRTSLLRLVRKLEEFGTDLVAVPCNTAHIFWSEMCEAVSIPVINMIEETVTEILRIHEKGVEEKQRSIGILATLGTIQTGLYQQALARRGLSCLLPSEQEQTELYEIIGWIKAQAKRDESLRRLESTVRSLAGKGVAGVILGCTELSLLKDRLHSPVPVFDALTILARATLREAGHHSLDVEP